MKMLVCLSCIAASLALTACNTVRGIGQDIEQLGTKIEGAAKK